MFYYGNCIAYKSLKCTLTYLLFLKMERSMTIHWFVSFKYSVLSCVHSAVITKMTCCLILRRFFRKRSEYVSLVNVVFVSCPCICEKSHQNVIRGIFSVFV